MANLLSKFLNAHFVLTYLCGFFDIAAAEEPDAGDPSALILTHRDLKQFELSDIVLTSTLDGSLQARLRDSGELLWTLDNAPLVDVQKLESNAGTQPDTSVTWMAEPSEKGGLYFFTAEGGIERIPASIWDLVQKAPFGMVENIVYTGSRHSTLYALDIKTGEIIQAFGETLAVSESKERVDPTGVVMIGRTEYTLDIHERMGSPGWRVRLGVWTPNSRDQDLATQYTSTLDSVYIVPLNNHTVVALAENDMRPQRWISESSSILIEAYDVLKSKSDGYLSLVRQPPLKLPGMATDWDLYVAQAQSDSLVVLSGPRYAALMGSAPKAKYCTGTGTDILGVHPMWCQEKRRAPESVPAISLLPPASAASPFPQYPRLDPPMDPVLTIDDSNVKKTWPLIVRAIENVGIVILVFMLFGFCAYQGWLPMDVLAALERIIGRSKQQAGQQAQAQAQSQSESESRSRSHSQSQSSGSEEPKKRKRGNRGGKRNNLAKKNSNSKEELKEKDLDAPRDLSTISVAADSPISITDTVLGYGSHGTTVFKGRYEGRDVAVKRMLLEFYDVASREVDILRESDDHPNVVRYYCKYETEQFLYIALELCPGTLEDMVRGTSQLHAGFRGLDALRQISEGLQHLHSLQIVHRDIKPQNILIALPMAKIKNRKRVSSSAAAEVRYLISDFGLCRKLEGEQSSFLPTFADSAAGTAGWAAPEISCTENTSDQTRLTRAVDIFSMGCLFYYVLTGGKHPFGDAHMRQVNIQQGKPPTLSESDCASPEAMELIPRMLDRNPQKRPTIDQIIAHPLFWTDQMKLDFLIKVSDRLEHDSRLEQSDLIDRLEVNAAYVVGEDWHTRFPPVFIENLGKYRRYHGDRILDLLRALRNKLHHYNDFTDELKQCVGALPSGYLDFFTSRFPHLLMTVYYYVEKEFRDEEAFASFFSF